MITQESEEFGSEIFESNAVSEFFFEIESLVEVLKSWSLMEFDQVDVEEKVLAARFSHRPIARKLLDIAKGDERTDVRSSAAKVWVMSQRTDISTAKRTYLDLFLPAVIRTNDRYVREGLLAGLAEIEHIDGIRTFLDIVEDNELSSLAREALAEF